MLRGSSLEPGDWKLVPQPAVEQGGHLVVVLDGVQPHPRQQVGVGEIVLVVGLVHVPHQREMDRLQTVLTVAAVGIVIIIVPLWPLLPATVP